MSGRAAHPFSVRDSAKLSYEMAGGEESFLDKNLLTPYEIIAEKLSALSPFP